MHELKVPAVLLLRDEIWLSSLAISGERAVVHRTKSKCWLVCPEHAHVSLDFGRAERQLVLCHASRGRLQMSVARASFVGDA